MDLPEFNQADVANVLADIAAAKQDLAPIAPAIKPTPGITVWFAVLLATAIVGGLLLPGGWNLVAVVVALVAILAIIGNVILHRPLGALINEQNVMSLSRFQMAVWTVVVLASYLSYVLFRIHSIGFAALVAGAPDPLNVIIDPNLLLLMGIGTTSFVASPVILGTKKDKTPAPTVAAKTALKSGDTKTEVNTNRQGTIYGNTAAADALVTDMFQGDEIGNTMHIDMAKVQMFFFTVVSAVAYLVMVFRNLKGTSPDLTHLPALSDGVVYAMGISHSGYLASKGIDHTPVQK